MDYVKEAERIRRELGDNFPVGHMAGRGFTKVKINDPIVGYKLEPKTINALLIKCQRTSPKHIYFVWELLDQPFKNRRIEETIDCFSGELESLENKQKIFYLGVYHNKLTNGGEFIPKKLQGIKTKLVIGSDDSAVNLKVFSRFGEDAYDLHYKRWLERKSFRCLVKEKSK